MHNKKNENISIAKNLHDEKVFSAIWDFFARPYAVGDLITWCMECYIKAKILRCDYVDYYVIADPERPAMPLQPMITSSNYNRYLIELNPIFYFNPLLRNLQVFGARKTFEHFLETHFDENAQIYPNPKSYTQEQGKDAYLFRHHEINDFYYNNGYIPYLKAPGGINVRKDLKHFGFQEDDFLVAVHLRQRKHDHYYGAVDLPRDANIDSWLDLFKYAAKKFPQVKFMLLGRKEEIPAEAYLLTNVYYLKEFGMGLVHELAFIHEANLFLGSNSGPAMMAMFSTTPYIIFYSPKSAAHTSYVTVTPVGCEKVPFAREEQWLSWLDDRTEVLIESFSRIYKKLKNKRV